MVVPPVGGLERVEPSKPGTLSATTPALIAAAAGVGLGHAIMPDHWVPLAVVGRARRYPLGRVARLSGLAGVAHVLVSLILGGVIIAVGLQFRSTIEHAQATIVGAVLIATGLAFTALELAGRGHTHRHTPEHAHAPEHEHGSDHHHAPGPAHHNEPLGDRHPRGLQGVAAIMVPFGAAASPDLTILPVFLAAATVGAGTAVGSLLAFALVTIATIVALTVIATAGGYQVRGRWLDRWGNAITAAALLVIGTLVLTRAI
jgi:nickel/cobalt transporter (NicO) family protein